MWKVRFFGVDENSFKFLEELKNDVFSSETHNIKDNKFVEYFILITGRDGEQATKILEIAEKELQVYVALLKINGFNSTLKVDHPCKVNEDGTKTIYVFLEDKITVTDSLKITNEKGDVLYSSYQQKISNNKILLENALRNEIKKELLILLGYGKNWINAYKIYEILKKHFKNENELKKHGELKYFAHSANSPNAIGIGNARHAVQTHQNPREIANIDTTYKKLIELSLEFIKQNV